MTTNAFRGVLRFLEGIGASTQQSQADILELKQPQISIYNENGPKNVAWWKKLTSNIYKLGYQRGQRETSAKLMAALVETFGEIPQSELAMALGVTQPAINHWLSGKAVPTKTNFENLLGLHVLRLVEPLVEFEEIDPQRSGKSWRFLGDKEASRRLRDTLKGTPASMSSMTAQVESHILERP